jgi:hypothetical protein
MKCRKHNVFPMHVLGKDRKVLRVEWLCSKCHNEIDVNGKIVEGVKAE